MKRICLLASALVLFQTAIALGAVPEKISFQGYVTDLSQAPISGEHVMGFKIYDSQTGGTLLWSDADTLTLSNGQFHAFLGDNTPLPAGIFSGSVLWLETEIDGSALPTRQPLVSVAYSFRAQKADTASVALFAAAGGDTSLWETDGTNVWRSTGNVGVGTETPAARLDVAGFIRVQSELAAERSIMIVDTKNSQGENVNTAQIFGVSSQGAPDARLGVNIINSNGTGWTEALSVLNGGNVGIGTDDPWDKLEVKDGEIYVRNTASDACVKLHRDTQAGTAGQGRVVVKHSVQAPYSGAIHFEPLWYDGSSYAFRSNEFVIDANGCVGIGTATPAATLHVAGDLCVTGAKNAIVPTSHGMTKVYSEESAEVWFSDYGEGQLENGRAVVALDPRFLETVTVNEENPVKVFISLKGDCNGVYYKPGTTSFEVVELVGGKSNAPFSWRVVAKRKGMEGARLETLKEQGRAE